LRSCGLVIATYEGRQVRYALADSHLARALGELVQVVLAVNSDEPCAAEQVAFGAAVEVTVS
jgi:DNA-binding transcriptional ArsR family regulator